MKLSISNIAWNNEDDPRMYNLMVQLGFSGLEIAPTRIFPDNPYEKLSDAKNWFTELSNVYGLFIPSMQSIWYGRSENFFETDEEYEILIEYSKKAIDFAASISCGNIVFGCPKNRNVRDKAKWDIGVSFFKQLGDYAYSHGTTIGMEANPTIYGTNYINSTLEAFELIQQVNSPGFKLNLDVGTMIHNEEVLSELEGRLELVNHVHISEPYLKPIEHRTLHVELFNMLRESGYNKYISIEMGKVENISQIENTMKYILELCG